MPLGYTLLVLALVATLVANVLFIACGKAGRENLCGWARRFVGLGTAGIVGASAYLMYLIGTHHFEVAYVAEYSALRSKAWYLIAGFWGGQEGSMLLWAFWTGILGLVLAYRSGNRTGKVWPVFGLAQSYLLILLLVKCPFALGKGAIPPDGKGLNPLLENYWMVIHPPILFLGFASTLIPSAWAFYGLLHRDWDGWAKAAFPWTLFSFATLGFGLSLGGYWAYETLGWGGFWAWDPVENTSLFPWLLLTALLHGMALQTKNQSWRIGNFLLGATPFAAMIYGTFLTRTGVLSDFSVHSFSSLGREGYWLILIFLLIWTIVPLGLLLVRWWDIPRGEKAAAKAKEPARFISRETAFATAAILMGLIGAFVALGMSSPLITKPFTAKGQAVQPEFYNQALYAPGIAMLILMSVSPYLTWRTGDTETAYKRLFPAYLTAIVLAMAMVGAGMYLGLRHPAMVILFAASIFAVIANGLLIAPRLKTHAARMSTGGFVAHAGIGLILAGVGVLVMFSRHETGILLMKNQPVEKMGYKLTYLGNTSHPFDRDNAIRIRVVDGNKQWEANPRYYYAPWASKDTLFANPPAIHRKFWGDVYIALGGEAKELTDDPQATSSNSLFSLKKGETKELGEYRFTLLSYGLDDKAIEVLKKHDEAAFKELSDVHMTAKVAVVYQGKEEIVTVSVRHEPKLGGAYSETALIPGPTGEKIALRMVPPPSEEESRDLQAASQQAVEEAKKAGAPGTTAFQQALMQNMAAFQGGRRVEEFATYQSLRFETFNAPDPNDVIFVDLSTKPLIGFVWMGTLLFTLGGLVAYRRRAGEAAA